MTKTSLKLVLPLLALALLLPLSAAKAFSVKTGSAVNIAQTETTDGNLYAAGSTVVIDGEVKGDVICAGQSVIINGKVDGDVLCAAQSINVLGEVMGSVRIAGSNVQINGKVGRNVTVIGSSIILGAKGQVAMDMLIIGSYANINGQIGGSLHGDGGMVTINGQIAKDVALTMDKDNRYQRLGAPSSLIVMNGAKIGGNLEYTSLINAAIANRDLIAGHVTRQIPVAGSRYNQNMMTGFATMFLWCMIIGLLGMLLTGLVLVLLFKDKILNLADQIIVMPGMKIGWGALVLLVGPIVLIFLALTIIGLPLAGLLFLVWLLAIVLSKMLIAIFIGLLVMGRYRHKRAKSDLKKETTANVLMAMIVGVAITGALFIIPIFGWLLGLLCLMLGLGTLWQSCQKCRSSK